MRFFTIRKFNYFDIIGFLFVSYLQGVTGSIWWVLLIIPLSMTSVLLEERYGR